MPDVLVTDEFRDWYEPLSEEEQAPIFRVVTLLAEHGTNLGAPYSSALRGSKYALRELRIQSAGKPLRVFYAFDVARNAVLLLGGDKTGDGRFYERLVPRAEQLWEAYLGGE